MWLVAATCGTMEKYISCVLNVPHINEHMAHQVAADIGEMTFFTNTMNYKLSCDSDQMLNVSLRLMSVL